MKLFVSQSRKLKLTHKYPETLHATRPSKLNLNTMYKKFIYARYKSTKCSFRTPFLSIYLKCQNINCDYDKKLYESHSIIVKYQNIHSTFAALSFLCGISSEITSASSANVDYYVICLVIYLFVFILHGRFDDVA